ncbi:GNAT family N-acetyltransferase [Mucilaginibacter sp. FT3.2]|uniref:GNAT family N-acetyltransferase n=1 Tax=Mucilaginibacter sp. FT3.2 TaxID=2723090 RepID=UPI001611BEF1|nr:GNAT family N-acetyltransferase [Mucilaginibacter sp. FT3.2]MBB6232483.1 GNAT superfamily N-acetyltransferase [Mucilaginibacter sp. FT3.2]
MLKVNSAKRELAIEILTSAFTDNKSVNYIVRQDNRRLLRIKALMAYSFDMCMEFGEVFLNENGEACALILYPHLKKFSFYALLLDIELIFKAITIWGIAKTLKRESKIKAIQPKEPMAYLWFIGVNRMFQHAGAGSNLLKEVIEYANQKDLPVYLETSTTENLAWYSRFGFHIYSELELGYKLFFLTRHLEKQ